MRSRWRAAALMAVLAAATVLGLFWHAGSRTTSVDLATRPIPLSLKVYADKPDATVDLWLAVRPRAGAPSIATLYVGAAGATGLVITSDQPDTTPAARRFARLPADRLAARSGQVYAAVVSSEAELEQMGQALVDFATFELPAGSVTNGRGVYAARLAAVGQGQAEVFTGVAYQSPAPLTRVDAASLYLGPAVATEADLRAPGARPEAPVRTTFTVPGGVSAVETLEGVREVVSAGDVLVNYPSNGTLDADAFVWRGEFGVTPELTVVARDAGERTSRNAFLSGVALATAAAALIALLQELPDRLRPIPLRRRRRPAD